MNNTCYYYDQIISLASKKNILFEEIRQYKLCRMYYNITVNITITMYIICIIELLEVSYNKFYLYKNDISLLTIRTMVYITWCRHVYLFTINLMQFMNICTTNSRM